MKSLRSKFLLVTLLAFLAATTVWASGWTTYSSAKFGFKMLIPEGTTVKTREWSGGWGGIYAEHDGVELFGIAKLGTQATAEEIEKFAVGALGISATGWKKVDEGSNSNGWKWYRTFEARQGGKLFYGAYGCGPKGTYLLCLETTAEDYAEHKSEYLKWCNSVALE